MRNKKSRSYTILTPKDFSIIWLNNIMALSVLGQGYSRKFDIEIFYYAFACFFK
jgi:hypothetical protein